MSIIPTLNLTSRSMIQSLWLIDINYRISNIFLNQINTNQKLFNRGTLKAGIVQIWRNFRIVNFLSYDRNVFKRNKMIVWFRLLPILWKNDLVKYQKGRHQKYDLAQIYSRLWQSVRSKFALKDTPYSILIGQYWFISLCRSITLPIKINQSIFISQSFIFECK